jgi:dimethylamine/trimethylamine dehydrogenase
MHSMSDFDILFERVHIGPVMAPNRFYQVPHCNGFGYRMPQSLATMRGMKAEGGWGVVCTEEVEIHHSSDLSPYFEGRLWSDDDIPALALMADAVHEHGALAGIELVYNGINAANLYSRVPPLGPRSMSVIGGGGFEPVQCRQMNKGDIRNVRRWHRDAALRAKRAGFDLVYCYAAHNLSIAMQMISRRYNDRTDEYGGSLENRSRLLRELIEDTKAAVGDKCGVVVRFAVDELLGEDGITHEGEGHDVIAMLAELPDLWDVNLSGWTNDSAPSRFEKEGYQEPYVGLVKSLTSKPVVGVGRFTSPETMASLVRRGVLDLIGAARPSISDPFLPKKIREGRIEDIRECIGCNICVTGDTRYVPIRCTQNPTMGEEWRRGWHPEIVAPKKSDREILVVGGGAAGLECARALGQRGYRVILAEARREWGGRVSRESRLPGLSEWQRVVDWRVGQIRKLKNVSVHLESEVTTDDVYEFGCSDLIVATGAGWRRDGIGRNRWKPIPGWKNAHVCTPDDLFTGREVEGAIVIFDDDHYYIGGAIAEWLARRGGRVSLITPAPLISYWSRYTLEQERIQKRLVETGVRLYPQSAVESISGHSVLLSSRTSRERIEIAAETVVLVTDRLPNDGLFQSLQPALADGRLQSLKLIGDADAPNTIAQAVFAGHLAAREFEEGITDGTPFRVERV